jgi:hypothetical protein
MNAITTIIPAGTPATPQEEWLNRGRDIAHRKVALEWDMAEWVAEGVRDGHAKQLGFDFAALGKELGIAPAKLREASVAAGKFPPALRDPSLSVEHHAAIASLDIEDALPLLKMASVERLKPSDLREAVVQRRLDTGQNFSDDDMGSSLEAILYRDFNRMASYPEHQERAAKTLMFAIKHGKTIIDPDEACEDDEDYEDDA